MLPTTCSSRDVVVVDAEEGACADHDADVEEVGEVLHGAPISLGSVVGHGTTVTVLLPAAG